MKRREFVFTTLALPALTAVAGLATGCGGGGNSGGTNASSSRGRGRFTLTLRWPDHNSRLIPFATQAIKATLTRTDTGEVLGTRLILGDDGRPQPSTQTFENLAPGQVTLTASAYPETDGTGVPMATGAVNGVIVANQTTTVHLTMGTTITRIDIEPQNPMVAPGAKVRLFATPRDAQGNVVMTQSGNWIWTIADRTVADMPSTASQAIEPTGIAVGTTAITAMESDSQVSATVTLTVTNGNTSGGTGANIFNDSYFVAMAIDPANRFAYVTNLSTSGGTGDVREFSIGTGGGLAPVVTPTIEAGKNPVSIATHPAAPFAYAINLADNSLSQYRITEFGSLTPLSPAKIDLPISEVGLSGTFPLKVLVDPAGKFVFVVSQYQNVFSFRINGDGTLTAINGVGVLAFPNALALTPPTANGQFLYAVSSGSGGQFSRNGITPIHVASDGTLSVISSQILQDVSGIGTAVVDPTGSYLYTGGGTSIFPYRIATDGSLTALSQPIPAGPGPSSGRVPGPNPYSLIVDPQRRALYNLNAGDNTLSQYRLNSGGTLTPFAQATIAVGRGTFFLKESPDGKFIYSGGSIPVGTTGLENQSFINRHQVNPDGSLTAIAG
jgi:6-phosphogluconolactonase (cycloisomerase 2 family)